MPKTVNLAFDKFNNEKVNLAQARTTQARSSRDWLIEQLKMMPDKVDSFPKLHNEKHIKFGSFARNTKIKPLDDIDIILTFDAQGSTYCEIEFGKKYTINVQEDAYRLIKLCDDNGLLNSRKITNKIVQSLNAVEHYKHAAIHRRQEGATLKLNSYEWNFDIIPAFYTTKDFYLIPDGAGKWKATDPRIDQRRINSINQKHKGRINQVIRTLKYWSKVSLGKSVSSYMFEILVLNYFDKLDEMHQRFDINLLAFWNYLTEAIYYDIVDPKGFQINLNVLDIETKQRVAQKAQKALDKGEEAFYAVEDFNDHRKAINKWKEVFGDQFPDYG